MTWMKKLNATVQWGEAWYWSENFAEAVGRWMTVTMTMTMTHSCEVPNVNQEPGPTDMSAGVMTPHKKNLICLYALLNGQGRLSVLCSRQWTASRVKKDQQAFAATNSIEFKMTSTHVLHEKKWEAWTSSLNPRIQLTRRIRSQGRVRQTLSSMWFELVSPSWLQFFDVWFVSRFVGDFCRCINRSQCGPWCVATRYSPPRTHPTSRRSGSVLVELDLAVDFICFVHCQQILRLLSFRMHFPLLSIFLDFFATLIHVSLFFVSFPFVSSVSSGLRKSFISSSHHFFWPSH